MVAKVANSKQSRIAWHCLLLKVGNFNRSLNSYLLVVIFMLVSLTAMGQYSGSYSDVAYGKTASASNYASGYPPSATVGGGGGNWCALTNSPAWLMVDLGNSYYIDGYGFDTGNSAELTDNFTFQGSTDGSSWNYLHSGSVSLDGNYRYNCTAGYYRYVRIYTTFSHTYGSIQHFYVYGTLSACTNPTSGGTIAAAQSGCTPFDPAAFTSSAAASGHSGTLEYNWQYAVSPFSTWNDIVSTNSATYNPPAGLTETTRYRRLARVSCKSDWTGAAVSNVLEATVSPASAGGTTKW